MEQLIDNKRILICCGSGGVGKTTAAAAIGVKAAQLGKNVLVITIDPAKRLANALGLTALGNEPQLVSLGEIATPPPRAEGHLYAMMLDTKRTFDELVERYAPNEAIRVQIFNNSFYQHVSNSLAGSKEFMAMEQLHFISTHHPFDLIILDTPPTQHALDFLEAPHRMISLLEGSLLDWLVKPYLVMGRIGLGMFRRTSTKLLKFLEGMTGYELLRDLSDFFLAFAGLFKGFKDRSQRILTLLRSPLTSVVLVCTPDSGSLSEVGLFSSRLEEEGLKIDGLIVNRVHRGAASHHLLALPDHVATQLKLGPDDNVDHRSLADRVWRTYQDHLALVEHDHQAIAWTASRFSVPIWEVPHFQRDLHSLLDLAEFANTVSRRG